jgi:transposase
LQRRYALREVFNALRWIARASALWRLLPTNFLPWPTVYQQTRRWPAAGCFEAVVRLSEAKRGFVLLPRRWMVEHSFAWLARFRRLARNYQCLPSVLAGQHFIAFACLLLHRIVPLMLSS